jgi:hypothetical protein
VNEKPKRSIYPSLSMRPAHIRKVLMCFSAAFTLWHFFQGHHSVLFV